MPASGGGTPPARAVGGRFHGPLRSPGGTGTVYPIGHISEAPPLPEIEPKPNNEERGRQYTEQRPGLKDEQARMVLGIEMLVKPYIEGRRVLAKKRRERFFEFSVPFDLVEKHGKLVGVTVE